MNDEKIIPFRPRPRVISDAELEAVRHATRNWDPRLRELMFPEHVKLERELARD